ncbi:MAG TPA: sugar phosphate isomerase/epimerase [Bryobacteraceae bacterium]|nr:sugar phosphate isomerase/epimerase [Bryobacteraceae bacterium]
MPNTVPTFSRRALLGTLAAGAAANAQDRKPKVWKPRLGILGPYTEANLAFAKEAGFTNMILGSSPRSRLDAAALNDTQIEQIKGTIDRSGIHISALQVTQNHISADTERRTRENAYFVKAIELAGKLGVPNIGTASGKDEKKSLIQQVDEIVRVYTEKYFPSCEKYNVRILWEPWPGGPNVATSPVGYDALFRAFGNSRFVGLQYDPSHLVWQMMDPIQTARDYVDKIHDVHLKDTEIRWPVLRRGGIHPVDDAEWWRYRLPGLGSIDWPAFFTVLQDVGYEGAMSVEHEDPVYDPPEGDGDFTEGCKTGFRMAQRYLRQYVPA